MDDKTVWTIVLGALLGVALENCVYRARLAELEDAIREHRAEVLAHAAPFDSTDPDHDPLTADRVLWSTLWPVEEPAQGDTHE